MHNILLIDNDVKTLKNLKEKIKEKIDVNVLIADSYNSARTILKDNKNSIAIAITELFLPDTEYGKAVDLTIAHKIPTIVLTNADEDEVKENFLKKSILEYISKDAPYSIEYLLKVINQTIKNFDRKVLIVDDSKTSLEFLRDELKKLNMKIYEAHDGKEALDVLYKHKGEISLVITDYYMPNMDGLELTYRIRKMYNKSQVGIIVQSSADTLQVASKFIRAGANDFLHKPFQTEIFFTRINSNVELLDLFQETRDLANKDFLTGAYNRRYFYDSAEIMYAKAKRKNRPLSVAMIDIDFFKKINDKFGHDIGDIAIKDTVKILKINLRKSDLLARFGGEEFCILLEDISKDDALKLFEKIKNIFENHIINIDDKQITFTISIGLNYSNEDSLNSMIRHADSALYTSKHNGRNQITLY